MNKNVLIVLVGGVLIAILVAFIVQASLGSKGEPGVVQKVQVLVAAKDLSVGDELSSSSMEWQDWPEETLFPGAIIREEGKKPLDVVSGRLRRNIAKGEPVRRSSMASEAKGNILAATLETGKRAVALKVSAAEMVGGFLAPGDYVDVVVTHEIRLGGRNQEMLSDTINHKASETVIQNIKILAVDQEAKREDEKAKVGRTVTLQVSPEEAEKLALASAMGELSLSLRGAGDTEIREADKDLTTDVKVSAVLRRIAELKKNMSQAGSVKNTGNRANIVRIYGRDEVQNVVVRP